MPRDQARDLEAELEVAALYRALGYTVEHDIELQGNQIDLLVSNEFGGYGSVATMVEVKRRTDKAISKKEVAEFVHVASALLDKSTISRAIMVATTGFTRFAKQYAEPFANIDLVTLRDLQHKLLNVDTALARFRQYYEKEPINDRYVDLTLNLWEHEMSAPASEPPPQTIKCADLFSLAIQMRTAAILILADYGAGKSTTLERVKLEAARRYALSKSSSPVPLLFQLKHFDIATGLEAFIQATHRRDLGCDVPLDAFWNMAASGYYLFLLDGFDEIAQLADSNRRASLLQELAPLLFSNSAAIMTTRPSYFLSAAEYRGALSRISSSQHLSAGVAKSQSAYGPDAQLHQTRWELRQHYDKGEQRNTQPRYATYSLQPLDDDQINEYLQKVEPRFQEIGIESAAAVRHFLDSIYDLSDLISRPILLDMVVFTVLNGDIDIGQEAMKLGPSGLYELYTTAKLDIEWAKGGSRQEGLSPDARREFAQECAIEMHRQGRTQLTSAQVARLVEESGSTPQELDEYLTDLRTCSFLTISDSGAMRFVHKSFQEFFLARAIKLLFDESKYGLLESQLPSEVLYFLGAFAFSDDEFRVRVAEFVRSGIIRFTAERRRVIRQNLATAYFFSREVVHGLEWKDVNTFPLKRRRLTLNACDLRAVSLLGLHIGSMRVSRSRVDVSLQAESIQELHLDGLEGKVSLSGDIARVTVQGGDFELVDGTPASGIDANACKVKLRLPSQRVLNLHAVSSQIELIGVSVLTLDAESSQLNLVLQSSSTIWGRAANCRLKLESGLLGRVRASCEQCLVIASGSAEEVFGSNVRDRNEAPLLTRSVLLVPADLELSPRWLTVAESVVLGGHCQKPEQWLELVGICFRDVRPQRDQPETLLVDVVKESLVCVSGWGESYRSVVGAFNQLVRSVGMGRPFDAAITEIEKLLLEVGASPTDLTGLLSQAMALIGTC